MLGSAGLGVDDSKVQQIGIDEVPKDSADCDPYAKLHSRPIGGIEQSFCCLLFRPVCCFKTLLKLLPALDE